MIKHQRWNAGRLVALLLLVAGAAIVLVPLLWTVSTSLKSLSRSFPGFFRSQGMALGELQKCGDGCSVFSVS